MQQKKNITAVKVDLVTQSAWLAFGLLSAALLTAPVTWAQVPERPRQSGRLLNPKPVHPAAPAGRAEYVLTDNDRRMIEQLLAEARPLAGSVTRMKLISSRLLGAPYLTHPLLGSLQEPEQLSARMDGFDCVTYVETVLALSRAANLDDFFQQLRALRYAGGEVSYATRLHFSTAWNKANIQRGILQDVTQGALTAECLKTLGAAVGLPARSERFRYFPKAKYAELTPTLRDGDLIFFVSGRQWLDTNHAGMVFRAGPQLLLRHASRSHTQVTEQPLADFVSKNKMIGFIVARPLATP